MYIVRNPHTRLYLNHDELIPESKEYDYMLINPQVQVYEAIGSKEALAWKLLRHKHILEDIIATLSLETGEFEEHFVKELISKWASLGLVHEKGRPFWRKVPPPWWQKFIWHEIAFKHFDRGLTRFYNRYLHWLTAKFMLLPYSVLLTAGILTLILAKVNGQVKLLTQISLGDFLLIFGLGVIALFLHEMGHAIAMKWAKAEILRAGFALYLGLPVFFVDTSTVWSKARLQRIITASGGIIMNGLIASMLTLTATVTENAYWQAILWELVLVNLFMIAISIIPFVKMDGYYILIDLIGIPKLDQKAYDELTLTLRHPWPISWKKRHMLLLAYAAISIISSVLLTLYSLWYWFGLIRRLFSFLN
jgi:putative peptide zinc metalloprotease protein